MPHSTQARSSVREVDVWRLIDQAVGALTPLSWCCHGGRQSKRRAGAPMQAASERGTQGAGGMSAVEAGARHVLGAGPLLHEATAASTTTTVRQGHHSTAAARHAHHHRHHAHAHGAATAQRVAAASRGR